MHTDDVSTGDDPKFLHAYYDTEGLKISTEVNQLEMLSTDERDPELAHKSYEVCLTKCQKNHQLFEKYTLSIDHTSKHRTYMNPNLLKIKIVSPLFLCFLI